MSDELRSIARAVASEFGVAVRDLRGRRRESVVVQARCAFAEIARHRTGLPFEVLGRFLDKHHTTVLHGRRRWLELEAADPDLSERRARIVRALGPRTRDPAYPLDAEALDTLERELEAALRAVRRTRATLAEATDRLSLEAVFG